MTTKAKIINSYSTCCFCQKPKYPAGIPVNYYPKFLFRQAAKKYALSHGLTIFQWSKQKTALAYTNTNCTHFDRHIIRLDWTIA